MDDAQALEAALVENGQREDVTPLDEATAFDRLGALGRSVEDIASRIGRSVGYVRSRLRLLDLVPEVQELLDGHRIHVGSALLLAQVSNDEQRRAAADIAKGRYRQGRKGNDAWTSSDVASLLREKSRRISLALWPVDDAELVPEAGACTTCPKRTGSQRALLAEMEGEDQCLDEACWDGKVTATLVAARGRGELVLEGPALTRCEDAGAIFPLDTDVDEEDFGEVYEIPDHSETMLTWEEGLARIGVTPTEWVLTVDDRMTQDPRVERWISARHLADIVEEHWPEAARLLRVRQVEWDERPATAQGAPARRVGDEAQEDADELDEVETLAHAEAERARAEKARAEREKADRERKVQDIARASMMRELVSYAEADGPERAEWWMALVRVALSNASAEACLAALRRRGLPPAPNGKNDSSWEAARRGLAAWLVTASSVGEVRGLLVELMAHPGLSSTFLFEKDDPNGDAGPYNIIPLLRETRADEDEPGIDVGKALKAARRKLSDDEHLAEHKAKKAADSAAKKATKKAAKAREVRDGA
jgi:ParB-like chromosome segregation protein Spo0J